MSVKSKEVVAHLGYWNSAGGDGLGILTRAQFYHSNLILTEEDKIAVWVSGRVSFLRPPLAEIIERETARVLPNYSRDRLICSPKYWGFAGKDTFGEITLFLALAKKYGWREMTIAGLGPHLPRIKRTAEYLLARNPDLDLNLDFLTTENQLTLAGRNCQVLAEQLIRSPEYARLEAQERWLRRVTGTDFGLIGYHGICVLTPIKGDIQKFFQSREKGEVDSHPDLDGVIRIMRRGIPASEEIKARYKLPLGQLVH